MKTLIKILVLLVFCQLNAQCFQKVSVGYEHTLVIKSDGSLWGWGSNQQRELGLNSTTPEYYTPQLIDNSNDWMKIFAGTGRTSFAIKNDGTLWGWGSGTFGRLGFGNQNNVSIPTQLGTNTDWEFVTSGAHTIARKIDGTLWAWGSNVFGQLNLNTNSIELTPVQISTETDWAQIVCGDNHTLAMKTDGTLWACGFNDKGQLGDGTTTDRLSFVQIGTDSDWASISAEIKHSVAIKTDGSIWGWGSNINEVLGLPSNVFQVSAPTQLGTDNDWLMADTNFYVITAIKNNGTLWENDENGFYQVESDTDWNFVDSGQAYSFMMKSNGTLWGIGGNDYGQLGLGNAIQGTTVPTQLDCSTLEIEEITNQNRLSIYPNPTKNILFIKNNTINRIDEIKISDLTGKILFETNNVTEIDFNNYQNGLYIVSITSSNKISKFKVIKK